MNDFVDFLDSISIALEIQQVAIECNARNVKVNFSKSILTLAWAGGGEGTISPPPKVNHCFQNWRVIFEKS